VERQELGSRSDETGSSRVLNGQMRPEADGSKLINWLKFFKLKKISLLQYTFSFSLSQAKMIRSAGWRPRRAD
jgi:hypothetical protein